MGLALNYMDLQMAKILITHYVRPKLEYATVVWNPHQEKDITKLEKVQRDITRRVPGLQGLTYEERLKELGITTVEKRRERRCNQHVQFRDREAFHRQRELCKVVR